MFGILLIDSKKKEKSNNFLFLYIFLNLKIPETQDVVLIEFHNGMKTQLIVGEVVENYLCSFLPSK